MFGPGREQPIREKQQGQKPEAGWWKINTDASFSALSSTGAGGMVIRDDEEGNLIAAAAKRYTYVINALMEEAMAARDGLWLVGNSAGR
jgi:hypothetical protein